MRVFKRPGIAADPVVGAGQPAIFAEAIESARQAPVRGGWYNDQQEDHPREAGTQLRTQFHIFEHVALQFIH